MALQPSRASPATGASAAPSALPGWPCGKSPVGAAATSAPWPRAHSTSPLLRRGSPSGCQTRPLLWELVGAPVGRGSAGRRGKPRRRTGARPRRELQPLQSDEGSAGCPASRNGSRCECPWAAGSPPSLHTRPSPPRARGARCGARPPRAWLPWAGRALLSSRLLCSFSMVGAFCSEPTCPCARSVGDPHTAIQPEAEGPARASWG